MQHLPDESPVVVKPWYLSRTVWFNIISFVILAVGIIIDNATSLELPPMLLAWLGVLVTIGNAYLRFQTYQPVGARREVIRMDNRAIKREVEDH